MTIIVPNTFDGLVLLTRQAEAALGSFDEESSNFKQGAWQAKNRLKVGTGFVGAYLQDQEGKALNGGRVVTAETLQTHITYLRDKPIEGFDFLTPHLAEGETGQDLRDGVIALMQAALDVRAPLGENKLARRALGRMTDAISGVGGNLTSAWQDKRNPVGQLSIIYDVLDGSEVPFVSLKAWIKSVDDYVRSITGYGGPSTGPSDQQITASFAAITGFATDIMMQAEARLPQPPVPALPKRTPIFINTAAPAI